MTANATTDASTTPNTVATGNAITGHRGLLLALRVAAVVIAVLAIVDPAVTSVRRSRPLLSVVAGSGAAADASAADVADLLRARFALVTAPLSAASGTVLVGDRLPDHADALAAPVVVVSPRATSSLATGPGVTIERVQAPPRVSLDTRVPILVTISMGDISMGDISIAGASMAGASMAGASDTVDLSLVHRATRDSDDGAMVVSRERVVVHRDSAVTRTLTFVPSAPGAAVLQVRASRAGRAETTRSDVLVDVGLPRWSVLFFDRRPSWMSTFVRRAIERDPRFAVTSRVITSTGISRETGRAPADLAGVASTESFDVVVVGAPDALTARDVDGLRSLLRTRGASVLILADHAASGPADALLGFGGWRTSSRRAPAEVVGATGMAASDSLRLRGLSIGIPVFLSASAEPIAVLREPVGDTSAISASANAVSTTTRARTVIWRMPVGAGQLIVSGAFDAWRYRDTTQSTFDATWRDLVEDAAAARQRPIELDLSATLVEPRDLLRITASVRDSLQTRPTSALVRLVGDSAETARAVRLFPSQPASRQVAEFRAPAATGTYEVMVGVGIDTVRAVLVVTPQVARGAENKPALLSAWAQSRGGQRVDAAALATLPAVLDSLIQPVARRATWHPMRSPWWIVPFSLLLAAEWWMRRRRGLA